MNPILDTSAGLVAAARADPLLLLANAVVWLDPLWRAAQDDLDYDGNAGAIALHIVRTAFPDLYAEAVERLRRGETDAAVERAICAGFTARGIPIDHLEMLGYGIPLTAFGVNLDDPDLYAARPDLLPIVNAFGVYPEPGSYSIDVPDVALTAGRALVDALHRQTDADWRQVGHALSWLFGCSGNSLIDLDDESLMELQPLDWTPDDIAFAVELIEEADGMMTDVRAGIALLTAEPERLALLAHNIQQIYEALKRRKGNERDFRWEWAAAGGRTE